MNPKKLQRDCISQLKSETTIGLGSKVEINETEHYKFRIVSRGDQLFYQDGNRALLIQMNPFDYAIYTDSISRWDDGKMVPQGEKNRIVERAKSYFKKYHNSELKVV